MKLGITHHRTIMALLAGCATLAMIACSLEGDLKQWDLIDWVDIVGEGGSVLFVLAWLLLILNSRPSGMVTNLLSAGLAGIFLASWQDFLDEIILMPATARWDSWVESLLMPLGMIVLTIGLYFWHREQQALSQQWQKRERLFRNHHQLDDLLSLTNADYLREQLRHELHSNNPIPPVLLMLDIDQFNSRSREIGFQESDRLLRATSELLLLNLRPQDLLCRYAGDRFAILLPSTDNKTAQQLGSDLQNSLSHCVMKTAQGERILQTASIVVCTAQADDNVDTFLARANQQLTLCKQQRTAIYRAA